MCDLTGKEGHAAVINEDEVTLDEVGGLQSSMASVPVKGKI